MRISFKRLFSSERDLLIRLQNSPPTDPIWADALNEYRKKAVGTVFKQYPGARKEEVEMAYEDAWMVMYKKLKGEQPVEEVLDLKSGKFSTYLIGITLNLYKNKQRVKKTTKDINVLMGDMPDVLAEDETLTPLFEALSELCKKVLWEAVQSLHPTCVRLIQLRYGEDLHWEAIGQALNAKHPNLQNRLTKCKKELRDKLVAARFHEECFNIFWP